VANRTEAHPSGPAKTIPGLPAQAEMGLPTRMIFFRKSQLRSAARGSPRRPLSQTVSEAIRRTLVWKPTSTILDLIAPKKTQKGHRATWQGFEVNFVVHPFRRTKKGRWNARGLDSRRPRNGLGRRADRWNCANGEKRRSRQEGERGDEASTRSWRQGGGGYLPQPRFSARWAGSRSRKSGARATTHVLAWRETMLYRFRREFDGGRMMVEARSAAEALCARCLEAGVRSTAVAGSTTSTTRPPRNGSALTPEPAEMAAGTPVGRARNGVGLIGIFYFYRK